jgi:hypothetical protein
MMNSNGLKPVRVSPRMGKRTHAHTRDVSLAQRPLVIQIIGEEPLATIHCLSDICIEAPALLFLHRPRSMTTNGGEHALRRACTGRNTQRLSFLLGRHQILPLATLIPQLIARIRVRISLFTITTKIEDKPRCSRRFNAV